jgi:hypothetical protein
LSVLHQEESLKDVFGTGAIGEFLIGIREVDPEFLFKKVKKSQLARLFADNLI